MSTITTPKIDLDKALAIGAITDEEYQKQRALIAAAAPILAPTPVTVAPIAPTKPSKPKKTKAHKPGEEAKDRIGHDGFKPIWGTGDPRYVETMTLGAAKNRVLVAVRGAKVGGGGRRAGQSVRALVAMYVGIKNHAVYGNYRPDDLLAVLRDPGFKAAMTADLHEWERTWEKDLANGKKVNVEARTKAKTLALAFLNNNNFSVVADAIETMMAKCVAEIPCKDKAGNPRPVSVMELLDVLMGLGITPTRLANLTWQA